MERNPNWAGQMFLALCPAAVGCLLGALILDWSGGTRVFMIVCVTVALIFAVLGATSPVLAIKKPLRSYRFLAGVAYSPLSRQAALVGLFMLLLLVHWILVLAGVYVQALGIVTVVVGAAAVLAAGLVYLLGSQPAWRHWSTPLALFGGLLALGLSTSLVIVLGWGDILVADTAGGLAARILGLVGVAGLAGAIGTRTAYLGNSGPRTAEASVLAREQFRWRRAEVGLVLIGGVAMAASFASDWVMIVAFIALLAALFVHWRLFFLTAAPLSWKAEVSWYLPAPAAGKE